MNIKVFEPMPGLFSAVDDDTYDGGDELAEVGSGQTAIEAVRDLLNQIEANEINE